MKRKITILALGLLLAAALAAAPASARTAAHEIESGDIIYIGESGLDLTGFGEVNRLVMYDRGTIHNIIPVTNPEDFDVLEVYVGTNTGHYIVEDADREELGYVLIRQPVVSLDVMLGTTSVDGLTITRGATVYFRLENNLVGLYPNTPQNADFAPLRYRVEVTTPAGGVVTTLAGVDLTIPINDTRARTQDIQLTNLAPGTYTAVAEPVDEQIEDFPDTNIIGETGLTVSPTTGPTITLVPTATPAPTPAPTPEETPTPTPEATPTPDATPTPEITPTPEPTPVETEPVPLSIFGAIGALAAAGSAILMRNRR